jgi:hypothetical protein
MEKFPNEVDTISIKDVRSFKAIKTTNLNLYSASSNGNLAHHPFSNTKNTKLKQGTKIFWFKLFQTWALLLLQGCRLQLHGEDLYLVY